MTIEALLTSIDSKLGTLIQISQTQIAECESGVAGALAEPTVAQQVGQAIAAAGVAATPAKARGRGRTSPAPAPTAPVAAPGAPEQPDPFAIGGNAPSAVVEKPRSMEEVRAALLVYQARNGQPAAVQLIKTATGKETLAALVVEDLPKLFKAAIPAGELSTDDVKIVLVKANERVSNSGLGVLEKFNAKNDKGETTITALKPEYFIAAISAAHAIK